MAPETRLPVLLQTAGCRCNAAPGILTYDWRAYHGPVPLPPSGL